MNLLILNGPASPRAPQSYPYRGTHRASPTYNDSLPAEHELNRLFMWYLEEGGQLGVVNDIGKALRFAELLNAHPLPRYSHFEVVEAVDDDRPSEAREHLLGFDLSGGFDNSLLWWWGPEPAAACPPSLANPSCTLRHLMYRYFAPQRNQHGLFPTATIASECLLAMDAIQRFDPSVFEGEDLIPHFQPVALYLVRA